MDHNRLQGSLGQKFSTGVIGVIDHHQEEHAIPSKTESEPRIIEKAGSCESAVDDSAYTQTWDTRIAKTALASILIDTANLTAPGKVQDVDREAVEYLDAKIQISPREAKTWNRNVFYKEIQEAKTNIGGLTLDEIMIKDYKQWTENGSNLGISSVVKPLDFLVAKSKGTFESTLESFMNLRDLSLFAIMTTSNSDGGDFQRQLLLQAEPSAHETAESFVTTAAMVLGLDEGLEIDVKRRTKPSVNDMWRNFWWQRDLSKSRKQAVSTKKTITMPPHKPLRIGFVPEHFSTPLHFALAHKSLPCTLHPFPSGTGHMITSLQAQEIDIGIGLTEAWINGLARASSSQQPAGYKLVGTYVESPLCWAISTGAERKDVAQETDPGEWPKGLKGRRMGVSRVGSGSYVMGFVLADVLGWLSSSSFGSDDQGQKEEPFEVVPLQTFEKLREGVNHGTADFFLWEHFTCKRYFDKGEIRRIGEIYTPWPSWHIVAADGILGDERLEEFLGVLDEGVRYFEEHQEEAVKYINTELDYEEGDAREWIKSVRFAKGVKGVRKSVVEQTLGVLKKAGVVEKGVNGEGMIANEREE
ncbi:MAG: hypothetical protein Q9164_006421 [Protoblastenia rupestris]